MKRIHTLLTLIAIGVAAPAFAGGGPYPVEEPSDGTGTSRAQVIAELREAQRLGLMSVGESDPPVATARQQSQIAAAGQRAAEAERMAAASTPPAAAPEQKAPPAPFARHEPGRKLFRL